MLVSLAPAIREMRALKDSDDDDGECDDEDCEDEDCGDDEGGGEEEEEVEMSTRNPTCAVSAVMESGGGDEADVSAEDISEEIEALITAQDDEEEDGVSDGLDPVFTPLDGTSLYTTTCAMNHSCTPNVLVTYADPPPPWRTADEAGSSSPLCVQVVALRDIALGEELCFSYLSSELSKEERLRALMEYGIPFCMCALCADFCAPCSPAEAATPAAAATTAGL
jgi:hypothetical protein